MNPEQNLAELLAIVGQLMVLSEAQRTIIDVLLNQNSELAAKLETLNVISKAMK